MKLRRFNAPDIRQAISLVREELGPEAAILSNRKVNGEVEIIAAVDYDDAMLAEAESYIREAQQMESVTPESRQPAASENAELRAILEKAQQLQQEHENQQTPTSGYGAAPTGSNHEGPSIFDYPGAGQGGGRRKSGARSLWNRSRPEDTTPPPAQFESSIQSGDDEDEPRTTADWLNRLKGPISFDDEATEPVSRQAPSQVEQSAARPAVETTATSPADKESIGGVWNELQHLRGLLERQLSSFAWGEMAKRYPHRAKAMRYLLELGLSPAVARRLLNEVSEGADFETVWRKALSLFVSRIPVEKEDVVLQGGVFALVGPTGVGKTTTIAKMAARYALEHGTKGIALVTTDNYRVGAQEQLRTYGRILGAPVLVANDANELKKTLKSLYDKQLILIDTAGMSQRDIRLTEQFAMLSEGSSLIKTYLVVSAATQLHVLDETVRAYQKAVLDGCILSKIDEANSLGGVLSVVSHHQIPMAYISDGQRVPEDLHRESALDLVKRAVALAQKYGQKIEDEVVEMAFGGGEVANDFS
jgi:flagellar biosynthesis protein FlhF